jgi:hypothetical protein
MFVPLGVEYRFGVAKRRGTSSGELKYISRDELKVFNGSGCGMRDRRAVYFHK